MTTDPHHYPPDLMALLIETIPRLCPSKDSVLLFFQGAGVPEKLLADHRAALQQDRATVRKAVIARSILTRLNDGGDAYLRQRREVVRRVEEFEDFSTCWPQDQLAARGLVSEVRRVRNVKDSFTRLQQEKNAEELRLRTQRQATAVEAQDRRERLSQVQRDLLALFAEYDPALRGRKLEPVLNRLFEIEKIKIRDSFTIAGEHGEGVVDQVDGVVALDGELYLVEMRWTADRVGVEGVSRHLTRVRSRGCARGIFIAGAGFTEGARLECQRSLSENVFVLCELEELVMLLEQSADLVAFLRRKIEAAVIERNPLVRPLREG